MLTVDLTQVDRKTDTKNDKYDRQKYLPTLAQQRTHNFTY